MCPVNDTERAHPASGRKHPLRAAFWAVQVRIAGNSTTSRRLFAPVSSITRRSIPMPTPPVGGIPCSSALDEVLVVRLRLFVAALQLLRLLLEAAALLVGVVQLAEAVGDLDPAGERLEALDQRPPRSGGTWRRARARPGSRGRRSAGPAPARRRLREQAVDQLAPALRRVGLGAHRRGQRLAGRVLGDVDAGALADRLAQGHPLPGRARSRSSTSPRCTFGRAQHPLGDLGDHRLDLVRGVLVVGAGLVPLEHRELGVVLVGDALVAEVLAQLVDAVDAADDQPLQVELGGDPQVEVAVERVVVGDERPRQGAAVERLQDRGLDLDEAALVEPAAHLADGAGAQGEEAAALLVGDQVELALAVAGLDVLEAVELVGRRAQALGEQAPAVDRQRELAAAPGRQRRPLDADDVAEVEVDQQLVGLLAEQVLAGVQLDLAAAVAEVEEAGLAVAAAGDDPARDPVPRLGLDPRPPGPRGQRAPRRCPRARRTRAGTARSPPLAAAPASPAGRGERRRAFCCSSRDYSSSLRATSYCERRAVPSAAERT